MRKLSARAVLGLGVLYDALAAFLYRISINISYRDARHGVVDFALMLSLVLGVAGTSIGSAMWARGASNRVVIGSVIGLVLLIVVYVRRATFGFDDPRIVVPAFAGLVVFFLLLGRAVGVAEQYR